MPRDLRGLPLKGRRCSVFPLLPAQTWHHTHSGAYDPRVPARMGWNCVPVSHIGHRLLHVVLGGTGRMVIKTGQRYWGGRAGRPIGAIEIQKHYARQMGRSEFWIFPNPAQRLAHAWCRLVFFVLWILWVGRNPQSWIARVLLVLLAIQGYTMLAAMQETWLWAVIFG